MKHGDFLAEHYIYFVPLWFWDIFQFFVFILLFLIQNGATNTFSSILKGSYQNSPILPLGGPN